MVVALDRELPGQVERDAPLAARTTWRVGGPAAAVVAVHSVEQLTTVAAVMTPDVPRLVIGRGSNLLVSDRGFPGVVLTLGPAFETIEFGDDFVTAGGATALPVLARQCAAAGRQGLGFFVGIPGSVGGAIRMNAGGHGRDTREVLIDADIVDLDGPTEVQRWSLDALGLGYRCSALGPGHVVIRARFAIGAGGPHELRAEVAEIVRWRAAHQPGGANAGSVFRNPPGDAAARLIDEECGLRGLRVGGAVVSEKHANFIQTEPGATAAHVHDLIRWVRDRVEQRTGIRLDIEVHEIGFDEP